MRLTTKITWAVILGVATGSFFPEANPYFKRGAEVFLSLINMIVVLLVLSTVSLGIVHFNTPRTLFRVARRTFALFIFFTSASLLLGMALAYLFDLGSSLHLSTPSNIHLEVPSIGSMILSWVPTNPLASLAKGNIIQILIFATFLGFSINAAGAKGKAVTECLEAIYSSMQQITGIVLQLAPIGVFAMAAYAIGSAYSTEWSLAALYFLLVYFLGAIILVAAIYSLALRFLWNLDPLKLYKGMRDALYVAFATCSSTATLPVTMRCMVQNLGVSRDVASFVAPMGATLNLNGLALFHGMSAVFIAQAYDISLGASGLLTIVLSSTLTAIGTGGVPGAGLLQLSAVFHSIGIPVEGIAVISVFEVFREMASSALNVLGDAVTGVVVAQSMDNLDEATYMHGASMEWESSLI